MIESFQEKWELAMSRFSTKIEAAALANNDFRRVLFTAPHSRFVLTTL